MVGIQIRLVILTMVIRMMNPKSPLFLKSWQTSDFAIIDAATKEVVFKGQVTQVNNAMGDFNLLDFTDFTQSGTYQLRCGQVTTKPFQIGSYQALWSESIPKF
jgi:N-terminal ig-like domain of cellulase.